ncbi:hypothetical protein FNV43_RR11892 [Rhamnella rubrinervis]|uniref:Uncharacterized protein n=1 Tax=Rhamnella rubrinervis TaxID=2594499 RepID=A0A8K0H6J0_9ROSA|nr:hypothetical protein FNV43_RR11892 [Rhamnella rubrinervis]
MDEQKLAAPFVSTMSLRHVPNLFLSLCIFYTLIIAPAFILGNAIENKVLNVGEELWKETLPLQMGSRLYRLQGLKSHTWYEVKISYPASIPASFSLQLKRGESDMSLHENRRLLNTEKLIFKTESLDSSVQEGMYILVSVEPEGFVAIRNVSERQFILFNIVCDELLLGIPHKAWWVVVLVLICLGLAFMIPFFLPPFLLQKSQDASKVS